MSVVTIRPVAPAGRALLFELLGDDVLAGGVGGWETLPRPRRPAVAGWVGEPELTLQLPLMLDGYAVPPTPSRVVEADCLLVESWGRRTGTADTPPVLAVAGPVRVPAGSRWVLQDIERGEQIRDIRGQRIQQLLTLTLLQYVAPVLVRSPAARARARLGR